MGEKNKQCHEYTKKERDILENGVPEQLHPNLLEFIRCNWMKPLSQEPLALINPSKN